MKNILVSLCSAGLLAMAFLAGIRVASAAVGPTYTQQWTFLQFLGCNPGYSGNATATSATFATNFSGHYVNDADPTDAHDIAIGSANFDLLAEPYRSTRATYGGITATGEQIYGLLAQFSADRFNAAQTAAAQAKTAAAAKAKPGS